MIKAKTNLLLSELRFVGGLRLPSLGSVEMDDVGKKLRSSAFIQVSDNVAHLLSTDGSAVVQTRIPVSSDSAQPMMFALPCDRDFTNSSCFGAELSIEVADNNLLISHSMGQIVLNSWVDIAKYVSLPPFAKPNGENTWEISASTLSQLLLTTSRFAADKVVSIFHMDGVIIEFAQNAVRAYAGDGHRLFEHKLWHKVYGSHGPVFVPKKYTRLISNITPVPSDSICVSQGNGYTSFECSPRSVIFPELVGKPHPPIENPKQKNNYLPVIAVDSAALKRAVQNVRNAVRDWSPKITFCAVIPDAITIQAEHHDLTMEIREQVPAEVFANISFSLHADFVLDFLKLASGAVMISTVLDGTGGVIFTAEPGYQYLLLHMI